MDDKQLGSFFRNNLTHYEGPGLDEEQWDRMSQRLSYLPAIIPWYQPLLKNGFLLSTLLMLLVNMGLLSYIYSPDKFWKMPFTQQAKMLVRTDTVYLTQYKYINTDSRGNGKVSWLNSSPFISEHYAHTSDISSPSLMTSYSEVISSMPSIGKKNVNSGIENFGNKGEPELKEGYALADSLDYNGEKETLATVYKEVPDYNQKQKKDSEVEKNIIGRDWDSMDISPEKDKKTGSVRPKSPFRLTHRIGASIGFLTSGNTWSSVRPTYSLGGYYELLLNPGLRLFSGVSYNYLRRNYPVSRISEQNKWDLFPDLADIQDMGAVEDIDEGVHIVEIPLQIKWFLPGEGKFSPFFAAGVVGQVFQEQNFTYGFDSENGELLYKAETDVKQFDINRFQLGIGTEYRLNSKWLGQTEAFFQQEFQPRQLTDTKSWILGVRTSLWLDLNNNTHR